MKYKIFIICLLLISLVSAGIYKEVKIKDIDKIEKNKICDKLKLNETCYGEIKLKDTGITAELVNISNQEVIKIWS